MTATRSAKPTTYAGANFRSRLEARWSAFFDLVEWRWTYEPFDADGYIPDFVIHGAFPFLVEVGPCIGAADYLDKGTKPRAAFPTERRTYGLPGDQVWLTVPEHWTLVVGVSAVYEEPRWRGSAAGFWAIDALSLTDHAPFWQRCGECGILAIESPDYNSYLRPCGHVSGLCLPNDRTYTIADLWSEAGNRVQWRR